MIVVYDVTVFSINEIVLALIDGREVDCQDVLSGCKPAGLCASGVSGAGIKGDALTMCTPISRASNKSSARLSMVCPGSPTIAPVPTLYPVRTNVRKPPIRFAKDE